MSDKPRFPVAAAIAAARPIIEALRPVTQQLISRIFETMKTIRIIKNRWGTGTNAMMRMKAQCGDAREILWGKPIQTGPDSWHVYGAHRKWWLPVNVEFTPKMLTFVFPKGVRGKKKIYSANAKLPHGGPANG